MRLLRLVMFGFFVALCASSWSSTVTGASQSPAYTTDFVRLRPGVSGILYSPIARGSEWNVGVVNMHPTSDYHGHASCSGLSSRGFRILCANSHYVNQSEDAVIFEELPIDVAAAVRYMRELPGIEKVVVLGHSGGGQLMAFYQNLAENGPSACSGPEKIRPCTDALADLPPADGVILLDAHPGGNRFTYLDPAVIDEEHPDQRDPALDMYDPANGWDPSGSHYSAEFTRDFYRAQAQRMNRLIAMAEERQARFRSGNSLYNDTEPFPIARVGARLWLADMSQLSHTREPHLVLKGDGSRVLEIPHSVRLPAAEPSRNWSYNSGVTTYTLDSFLSYGAIRATEDFLVTEDSIEGVVWESSNAATPSNIRGVRVPTLFAAMGAHYFIAPTGMVHFRRLMC